MLLWSYHCPNFGVPAFWYWHFPMLPIVCGDVLCGASCPRVCGVLSFSFIFA
jgi:hypothetical protein